MIMCINDVEVVFVSKLRYAYALISRVNLTSRYFTRRFKFDSEQHCHC